MLYLCWAEQATVTTASHERANCRLHQIMTNRLKFRGKCYFFEEKNYIVNVL